MRKSLASVAVMVGLAACGRNQTSSSEDFSRDLQLASTTVDLAAPAVNPANLGVLETQPSSAPQHTSTVRKAPSGNKVVQSRTPTVAATPTQEVATADLSEQAESLAEVPAETAEPVAVAPEPQGVAMPEGDDEGEYGTSGNGGGIFGPGSGGIGVVIRGGGIGDDDHCELPIPVGGRSRPVYRPNPGIGTGRFPPPRPTAGSSTPRRTPGNGTVTRRRPH